MLAIPNVATTLPDVEANAAFIAGLFQARGFTTRLLIAAPGTPPSKKGWFIVRDTSDTATHLAHSKVLRRYGIGVHAGLLAAPNW